LPECSVITVLEMLSENTRTFISQDESVIMGHSTLRKPMPLYEYKCIKCGSVFEVLQKVDDLPLKKCIHCQGTVKKLLSPPALQFKGSGWYVTDYASKGNRESDSKPEEKPTKEKDTSAKKKNTASSTSDKK
jgi:putative FmdB family regulatory protein